MTVDDQLVGKGETVSETGRSRRDFVRHAGKAIYIAPTLTLLGAAPASAQFGSPPPPPGSAPAPPGPNR